MRCISLLTGLTVTITAAACAGGAVPLPLAEALVVPKPSDAKSNTAAQAACANGNATITDLDNRVDALNASVKDDVALLQAFAKQAPPAGPVVRYQVHSGDRVLDVQLVETEDQIAVTATENSKAVISGTYASDESQGALTIDSSISSAWSKDGATVKIVRTENAISAAVDIDADLVKLAITDGGDDVAAQWDRATHAGQVAVSNGAAACWSSGETVDDMCDVDCAP